MPSLRAQLAIWLLVPLLGLWAINGWWTYETAIESADRAHDRTLQGSALAIAERISVIGKTVVVDLPYASLEMLESSNQSRVYYRVSTAQGVSITGYDDLQRPALLPEVDKPTFYDATYRGERVRVAALSKRLYDESVNEPVLVQVAETVELRQLLSSQIMLDSAGKQLLLILLAAALMWQSLSRGLRPLYQLRREIEQRGHSDLSAISVDRVPAEMKPLIEAINTHTAQLGQVLSAQRQFVDDAAHQLKTPLTLLHTQADLAAQQSDIGAAREVLDDLRANAASVSHLVDQLLALNRAEAEPMTQLVAVDLTELARQTTFLRLPLALAKHIDLGFEGDQSAPILGNMVLLHELLGNLLDNAIRFTPEAGCITVRVAVADRTVTLQVEDSGPGITESQRQRVFDRFYQIPGRESAGCGLGLAIVKKIAALHQAGLAVSAPDGHTGAGTGTLMTVEFAAAPPGP